MKTSWYVVALASLLVIILFGIFYFLKSTQKTSRNEILSGYGVVICENIEGKTCYIKCESCKYKYLYPINLPENLRSNNIRVKFIAQVVPNVYTFHKGIPVKIINISRVSNTFTARVLAIEKGNVSGT